MQLFQSQHQHYAIRSVLARFENLSRGTIEKILMPAVNEPTFSGHIRKLITPCAWATHVEVMAAATYFQVPVLTPQKQSTDGNALPHKVLLHTLDTSYRGHVVIHNQHYGCIVSQETGKLYATLPTLTENHTFVMGELSEPFRKIPILLWGIWKSRKRK